MGEEVERADNSRGELFTPTEDDRVGRLFGLTGVGTESKSWSAAHKPPTAAVQTNTAGVAGGCRMRKAFITTPTPTKVSITSLKAAHMNEDGSQVDYQGMAASPQFQDYVETARLLIDHDPSLFAEDQRKAFFLNIYNSLTLHGMVHQSAIKGALTAPKEVPGFWSITCYNIGGLVYCLDDIEHGVLRANKGHPAAKKAQFSNDDPRSNVALTTLDPRLDSQLDTASKSFLQQEVKVTQGQTDARVETSRLLLWYGADFGKDDRSVIQWLVGILKDDDIGAELEGALAKEDVTLVFKDYDWGANAGVGPL